MTRGCDAWTTRPALPPGATLLAAVAAPGRLVVVGGSTSATAHGSTRVDMYDPAANAWRPAASLPTGRSAAGVVALHDRLYVLGGALPGATLVATGQAHVYTSVLEPTVVVTQAGAPATYRPVTLGPLTYGATGGTRSLTVTATPGDAAWTVESDGAWLTTSPGSGVGSKTVTVTAAAYATSVVPRTATLTFRRGDGSVWQTVAATQTGPAPTLGAAPLAWTVDAAGGTREITVTAVPGDAMVAWTAVSNAPAWLTVSAAGGTGSGTVTLTAAAQPSAMERVGTVKLAGKVVTVRQRGALPVLTLTPPTWDVGASGGTQPVTLTATPSDVMWTAVSSAPWLRVNGQGMVTAIGDAGGPVDAEGAGAYDVGGGADGGAAGGRDVAGAAAAGGRRGGGQRSARSTGGCMWPGARRGRSTGPTSACTRWRPTRGRRWRRAGSRRRR